MNKFIKNSLEILIYGLLFCVGALIILLFCKQSLILNSDLGIFALFLTVFGFLITIISVGIPIFISQDIRDKQKDLKKKQKEFEIFSNETRAEFEKFKKDVLNNRERMRNEMELIYEKIKDKEGENNKEELQ